MKHTVSTRLDKVLEHIDSNYAAVIVASKRARQINSYYRHVDEAGFSDTPPPLVESRSNNYLTIAFEEVVEGKLKYEYHD